MSQISPPIRILLVAAVALAAAWVLVLQPKPEEDVAPAEPTVAETAPAETEANTSLGKAVDAAKDAAKTSDERNAAAGGATADKPATTQAAPQTESAPAPATKATNDPELAGLPGWLQSKIDKKVVAILFWDKDATDDRRTRAALADAFNGRGDVVKRAVPIARIARYGEVARGVDVSQSPTLMVIDRDRSASALVGYANVDAINQLIIDGLLATDNPAEKVTLVKRMQSACRGFATTDTISAGDTTRSSAYSRDLAAVSASMAETLRAAPAPTGAYAPQARLLRDYVRSEQAVAARIRSTAVGGGLVDSRAIRQAQRSNDKLESRATLELNAIGVTGCN